MNDKTSDPQPAIVYIHTGPDPILMKGLWVAIYSAKRLLSESRIRCVVADDELLELDHNTPAMLKGHIDWVPVKVPPGSPVYRNRWIKTQLVKWLDGPSLYLDSDTLVVRPLRWSELSSYSFATGLNRLCDQQFKEIPCRINDIDLFVAAGWEWKPALDCFFRNGGVLYIIPSQKVEVIFSAWHQKWLEFVSLTGKYFDQPSLNLVLLEQGWSERLPDRWNAPVRVIPGSSRGAYIQHYYSSVGIEEIGECNLLGKLVKMMGEERFDSNLANKLLARRKVYVGMGGRIKGYMLAGQYIFMLRSILRRVFCKAPAWIS